MISGVANLLAYPDQVSFVGLRALGRGPMIQVMWIVPGEVELGALRRFDEGLGHTLLGRRVERSSVPAGRHHWVRNPDPGEIRFGGEALDPMLLADWRASLVRRPVDPESGPGRSLAARPLSDGTTAVVLTVSHTLADGSAIVESVHDAVLGRRADIALDSARRSVTWRERTQDARDVVRSLPDAVKGAGAVLQMARRGRRVPAGPHADVADDARDDGRAIVGVPAVDVFVDEELWRERAHALGGSSSSLLAGLVAHLGMAFGRADPEGRVVLDVPVSERTAGDTRANAFIPMALRVDPTGVTRDLRELRTALAEAVAQARAHGDAMTAVQALVPFIPQGWVRRFDGLANGGGVVGCSHLGRLDATVGRPLGTDAIAIVVSRGEPIPTAHLDRLGGLLRVIQCASAGRVAIAVRAWRSGVVETSAQLRPAVRQAMDDFGLSAEVR